MGPAAVDAAASIRPISIEPESPMKIRARWKLCGRKPRHAPQGPRRSPQAVEQHVAAVVAKQSDREDADRHRGDQTEAGGQPVEPVDEVHGADDRDRQARVSRIEDTWSSTMVPTPPIGM